MNRNSETYVDLTAIWDQCDLALDPKLGKSKLIAYIANAKGRKVLQQISPENFPDTIWTEPHQDLRDWRAAMIRMSANRETARDIAIGIAAIAVDHGLRVMVRHGPRSNFEIARFGTLAAFLAAVPHAGNA